ncbi:acyl-homoserine-lactone synthase [Pseudomonas cucumis]|uniref:Acyl-homoserine-lactone synthase n=1 Tax=Pseudomonas cucumis TaxID=2954082 RepID=A0ABY9F513_9PSED|nr:acyl-homoserine-lactone synthase [Pseudomonas cucumis]WLG87746.1 acyl-homoserine-lactone synthase [Pseudomonas cucumis]
MDNKEVDEYDSLNPYYLLISQYTGDEVIGCWRILETVGPTCSKILSLNCSTVSRSAKYSNA